MVLWFTNLHGHNNEEDLYIENFPFKTDLARKCSRDIMLIEALFSKPTHAHEGSQSWTLEAGHEALSLECDPMIADMYS